MSEGLGESLESGLKEKINRMFSSCEEVVGIDHIVKILSGSTTHSGGNLINAYIGLEPSGKAHLGWLVLAETMQNLLKEGVNVTILLVHESCITSCCSCIFSVFALQSAFNVASLHAY